MEKQQIKPGDKTQENREQSKNIKNDSNHDLNQNRENKSEKGDEEGTKLPGRELRTPVANEKAQVPKSDGKE